MKTFLPSILFVSILITFIFVSCEKEDEEDNTIYNFCLVTKINTQGLDTGQYSQKFTYDNFDRITKFDWTGPHDMSVTYQAGKIIAGDPLTPNTFSIYYLNPDSSAYASASYMNGQQQDSNLYYYENGYLVKQVRYTQVLGKDSSILTYTNGNLTRIVIYNSNGLSSQANMEYTDIPSKSWIYQMNVPFVNNGLFMPWFGKTGKNLVKTIRSEFNGNPDPLNMTYEMNASGYVKSYTATFLSSVDKKTFEYRCR